MEVPRFSTVRISTGPRLHYAEQGRTDGHPVLFLHGWPDSWFSFSRVLAALPPHVHAFVPDQRGFGDSDRPAQGYRISDFAADVVAFLDALEFRRATIVGHSFGTLVARQAAISDPERVDRLVLIGTGVTKENPVLQEVRASLLELGDTVTVEFARDFQAGTAYAPLPGPFFDRIVDESLKLPPRLWREVFDAIVGYDDREQIDRITAPTLLMWGTRDALFPRHDQDALVTAMQDARLAVYEDIGHCPNWECPERVAADLQTLAGL